MNVLQGDIETWFVVFWKKNINNAPMFSREWREDCWAIGGFRHVSAFGYSAKSDCWVHFNPNPQGIDFVIVPEGEESQNMLTILLQCGSVIEIKSKPSQKFLRRGIFNCVTAVKHLIGSSCGALTPWGLRNNLLRTGKEWSYGLQNDPGAEEYAGPCE